MMDAVSMQALVPRRTRLTICPMPFILLKAREVQQHREAGEQLQPFGKARQTPPWLARWSVWNSDAELLHIIILIRMAL